MPALSVPALASLLILAAFGNPTGAASTFFTAGGLDTDTLFDQAVGTNGRRCITCHVPSAGWTLVPADVQARFEASGGLDPLFRPSDGATSPLADVSSVEARRAAYSLLLRRGLIRVGLPLPAAAEFILEAVDDPHGFASAAELSLFRRPLPATNLGFLSTVMWDGRVSTPGQPIRVSLANQAASAALGHLEATRPLTHAERARIVAFETSHVTAQSRDDAAGELHADGALGGPTFLTSQAFYPGINSSRDPTGRSFDLRVFTVFDQWARAEGERSAARRAIARGQALFNERRFGIRAMTCTSCHNTPNAGSNSNGLVVELGVSDASRRLPDLPLYTLRCVATGKIMKTTDPGRALVTGRCADIGAFKVPTLRGLAARAPYFHNGLAATVEDVLRFYEGRFGLGLTASETRDLATFLRAL